MEILALIGPSGTGKSHSAVLIAHENDADLIIDDGLLIKGSRILAGTSAKKQSTKIGAIKTALFQNPLQAQEVQKAINEENPDRILVLGTSKDMVEKICARLELPFPIRYINIEEATSKSDVVRAKKMRQQFGKHVVPVPTLEVKPRFSGTLIEPLPTFFRNRIKSKRPDRSLWVDQSVVRPTFNYLGKFYISNQVLIQLARHAVRQTPGIVKTLRVNTKTNDDGVVLNLEVAVKPTDNLPRVIRLAQQRIKEIIEHMTALNVLSINIEAKKIIG